MSRWWTDRRRRLACVALDRQGLAWQDGRDTRTASVEAGLPVLLAGGMAGQRLHVIAGGDMAVHWLQSPPHGLRSIEELKLAAQVRCAQLHGGDPQSWRVAGDWSAARPFACAALPVPALASLERQARESGRSLRWHTAWSLLCSRRAWHFPSHGWSALRSPTQLLLWHARAGRVNALSRLALDPGWTREHIKDAARARLRLERAQSELPVVDQVCWLDLQSPQALGLVPVRPAAGEVLREALAVLALQGLVPGTP